MNKIRAGVRKLLSALRQRWKVLLPLAAIIVIASTILLHILRPSPPDTPAELIQRNVYNTQELIASTYALQQTLEERTTSRGVYKTYQHRLETFYDHCNYTKTLAHISVDLPELNEGVRSHNQRSRDICDDIQELLTYSYSSANSTKDLLSLRTEKRRRFDLLYTYSSTNEIQTATDRSLKEFGKTKNTLQYEGQDEMKILIEKLQAITDKSNDDQIIRESAHDTQMQLYNQHATFWRSFGRIADMRKVLDDQLTAYCQDAAVASVDISSCTSKQ